MMQLVLLVLFRFRLVVIAAVVILPYTMPLAAGEADFRSLINRGRQAVEAADYDIAVKMLERAVQLQPGSADAHLQLARAHSGRKQLKPAALHFNKTLSLRPGDVSALMGLAAIYEGTGDYSEAEKSYRQAMAGGELDRAERALASLLARTGRFEEAERRLKALLSASEGDSETRYELALSFALRGECALAIPLFKRVTVARPEKLSALFQLGNCLSRIGQEAEARNVLERFHAASEAERKKVNREKQVYFMLLEADGLAEAGKMDEAVAKARKAAELDPGSFKARAFLGSMLTELGRNAEALVVLRQAAKLNPSDAITLTEVGRHLAMSGQMKEALTWFKRAASASATLPEPHKFLAIIYQQMGRKAEAAREREIYRKLAGGR